MYFGKNQVQDFFAPHFRKQISRGACIDLTEPPFIEAFVKSAALCEKVNSGEWRTRQLAK